MSSVKNRSVPRKRGYHSPQRKEQAEATRQRLIVGARKLFARKGYAATSIDAIAREADVAVQTFYATIGSKSALLLALLDLMEREADVPRLEAELKATTDAKEQLRAFVEFGVRLYARAADVLEVIRAAGTAEKDLGALWREGEKRRRQAQRGLVTEWSQRGSLRVDVNLATVTDIFWAMTGPDSYRLFVRECGWSAGRYVEWLTGATGDLILKKEK